MKLRIIMAIKGGLGNQVTQYILGYRIAKKNNRCLVIDKSYYNRLFHPIKEQGFLYPFKLANFFKINKYTNFFISIFIGVISKRPRLKKIYNWISIEIFPFISSIPMCLDEEEIINFNFNIKKNIILFGYFQFSKLLGNNDNLSLKKPKLSYGAQKILSITQDNYCISIHVRRYDTFESGKTNRNHPYAELSSNYFKNSLNYLTQKIDTKKIKIFIFSDNIEWVKKNIYLENKAFLVDDKISDIEQFYLMSLMNCNIISNSTFSYMPAILNKKENIVVCPQDWFKLKSMNKFLFLPSNWIKIKN
jgi:hypothetical protein